MRKMRVSLSGYGFHVHSALSFGSFKAEFCLVAEDPTPYRSISVSIRNNPLVEGDGPVEHSISHSNQKGLSRRMSHVFW